MDNAEWSVVMEGRVDGVKWKVVMEGIEWRTLNGRRRTKGVKRRASNGWRQIECVGWKLVIEGEEWLWRTSS